MVLAACILSSVVEESWTELYRVWCSDEVRQVGSNIIGELAAAAAADDDDDDDNDDLSFPLSFS